VLRAKNITNKPRINEDPKDAMLREFQVSGMLEGRWKLRLRGACLAVEGLQQATWHVSTLQLHSQQQVISVACLHVTWRAWTRVHDGCGGLKALGLSSAADVSCVLQEEIARLKAELLARQQAGAGGEATPGSGEVSPSPCI
jgi:hypothetical protein